MYDKNVLGKGRTIVPTASLSTQQLIPFTVFRAGLIVVASRVNSNLLSQMSERRTRERIRQNVAASRPVTPVTSRKSHDIYDADGNLRLDRQDKTPQDTPILSRDHNKENQGAVPAALIAWERPMETAVVVSTPTIEQPETPVNKSWGLGSLLPSAAKTVGRFLPSFGRSPAKDPRPPATEPRPHVSATQGRQARLALLRGPHSKASPTQASEARNKARRERKNLEEELMRERARAAAMEQEIKLLRSMSPQSESPAERLGQKRLHPDDPPARGFSINPDIFASDESEDEATPVAKRARSGPALFESEDVPPSPHSESPLATRQPQTVSVQRTILHTEIERKTAASVGGRSRNENIFSLHESVTRSRETPCRVPPNTFRVPSPTASDSEEEEGPAPSIEKSPSPEADKTISTAASLQLQRDQALKYSAKTPSRLAQSSKLSPPNHPPFSPPPPIRPNEDVAKAANAAPFSISPRDDASRKEMVHMAAENPPLHETEAQIQVPTEKVTIRSPSPDILPSTNDIISLQWEEKHAEAAYHVFKQDFEQSEAQVTDEQWTLAAVKRIIERDWTMQHTEAASRVFEQGFNAFLSIEAPSVTT